MVSIYKANSESQVINFILKNLNLDPALLTKLVVLKNIVLTNAIISSYIQEPDHTS